MIFPLLLIAKRCQVDGPHGWADIIIDHYADEIRGNGSKEEAVAKIQKMLDGVTYEGRPK